MKRNLIPTINLFIVVVLILIPALVGYFYTRKIRNYDDLLALYECNDSPCEADFDGDGIVGQLSIDRIAPQEEFDSWFVVRDSEKELLRVPRRSFDNSLRTHAALVYDVPKTRLIIYDHIVGRAAPRSEVYVFDGSRLVQVSANEKDKAILAAIGARDDTGTLNNWALFQAFICPALILYYVLLSLILLFLLVRRGGPRRFDQQVT